ncbi:MAG: glycosyltransferase [Patescibacteria group bacterium]
MPRLYIGFIAYGRSTSKYLPYFLKSISEQKFQDFKVLVVDNSSLEDRENMELIEQYYPSAEIDRPGSNLGFAKAYNRLIAKASREGGELFLVINPDMILDKYALKNMINAIDSFGVDSVSPKILRWDFENAKKTDIIDSCGIELLSGLRFVDIGQGKRDGEEFEKERKILGPSGAAGMYKIKSLEKVAYIKENGDKEYFDELMFMYKEDCDLAYRLYSAGCNSRYLPQAVVYHDRTASGRGQKNLEVARNRKNKSRQVKKWSFLNQQIIFMKHWRKQDVKNKFYIIWLELKMLIFILIFEPYLFGQLKELFFMRKNIKNKKVNS